MSDPRQVMERHIAAFNSRDADADPLRGDGSRHTGKPVEFTVTSIFTIRAGKIAEQRSSTDLLALMGQLGVIPVPEEATSS
jgi:predicted ester cyclase